MNSDLKNAAYIIIAHGSKAPKSNDAFMQFLKKFQKAYPHRKVYGAYLDVIKPTIPETIQKSIENGAREIFILPLLFFPGKHVADDIPAMIEKAKADHPEVDFHYAGPLCDDPKMLGMLDQRLKDMQSA